MKLLTIVLLIGSSIYFSTQQLHKKPILNHVAVYVINLQKSQFFYEQIIGIDTIPNPFNDHKHTWFKIGEHAQLHLIEGATSIKDHDKNSHLCFSVTSLETLMQTLDRNQVAYTNWPGTAKLPTIRPDGVKQIYFQDPDGFWVEANNDRY